VLRPYLMNWLMWYFFIRSVEADVAAGKPVRRRT
jgi:hypothetical protein